MLIAALAKSVDGHLLESGKVKGKTLQSSRCRADSKHFFAFFCMSHTDRGSYITIQTRVNEPNHSIAGVILSKYIWITAGLKS